MIAAANRTIRIRRALEKRLINMQGHLQGTPPLVALEPGKHRCADPEETLRLLMVRYLPKVKEGRATKQDQVRVLTLILELADMALTDDLRFLDAWNAIYETVCEKQHIMQDIKPLVIPFMQCYAFLLQSYINKLM